MAVQLHMESVTCVGLGLSLDSPLTEQALPCRQVDAIGQANQDTHRVGPGLPLDSPVSHPASARDELFTNEHLP